jgi:hypothetical protein
MEFLLFTCPGLTQPKLIQLGGAFVLKMKALYVLPFILIGIVNAQWGWEEEMPERGFTTSTSTVKPVTTSQTPLATTLPTSTTTSRPVTTTIAPNMTIPASSPDPVVTVNTTTTILPSTTSARKTTTYRRFTTPTPVIRSSTTFYRVPTRFTYRPSTRLNPVTTTFRPTVTTTIRSTTQTTSSPSTVPSTVSTTTSGSAPTPQVEYGSGNVNIDRWLDVFAFVANNAYGVFANSDNDTADFENSNETAHKHNGTRDDDSGKAYWGDGWAAFFNDEFQGKVFIIFKYLLLKVTVPD